MSERAKETQNRKKFNELNMMGRVQKINMPTESMQKVELEHKHEERDGMWSPQERSESAAEAEIEIIMRISAFTCRTHFVNVYIASTLWIASTFPSKQSNYHLGSFPASE